MIALTLNELVSQNIGGFLTIVGSLLAVLITGFFSSRRPKKSIGERELLFMEQQSKENAAMNLRIDELTQKIDDLNDRIDEEVHKRRAWETQYYILDNWVIKGAIPPRPELPDSMKNH
jgi:hypothetical protein